MEDEKKAQVIICKCGSVIAACAEPYCYSDKSWNKDMVKYAQKGYKIDVMNCPEFCIEKCKCNNQNELF